MHFGAPTRDYRYLTRDELVQGGSCATAWSELSSWNGLWDSVFL